MLHTCDAQLLDSGDRWLRQIQRPAIALEVRVRAGEDVQHQSEIVRAAADRPGHSQRLLVHAEWVRWACNVITGHLISQNQNTGVSGVFLQQLVRAAADCL